MAARINAGTVDAEDGEEDEQINFAKMAGDLDSNPKIRRAGRNAREVFLFVLRRVAMFKTPGRIPVSNVDAFYMAEQLMMTEAEAEDGLERCLKRFGKMEPLLEIAGGKVVVVGWTQQWGRRPLTTAERKQRQRERERATEPEDAEAGVEALRPRAPSVTAGHGESREVTASHECHGSEERRSEEIRSDDLDPVERENTIVPADVATARMLAHFAAGEAAVKPVTRRPPKRALLRSSLSAEVMPKGWRPPATPEIAELEKRATERGVHVPYALEKFVAQQIEKGATSCDWVASWHVYLTRERPTPDDVRDAWTRVERADATRAALDVVRVEQETKASLAAEDRESVQRDWEALSKNNFRFPEKATG